MNTLTPARTGPHTTLNLVTTQGIEFVDLTDYLDRFVLDAKMHVGILNIQTSHTTTAIVVNEHEPLLLTDFRALLERTASCSGVYAHDDMSRRAGVCADEAANGHAHCRALFLPTSACLNIVDGRLALGRWQRVFLVELDGPRARTISVVAVGEPAL